MEKTRIKIFDTRTSKDGLEAVYAELPNGTRAWFAVPLHCNPNGTEISVYIKGLSMALQPIIHTDEIRKKLGKTDDFFFAEDSNYFSYVGGKVLFFESEEGEDHVIRVELSCEGVIFDIFMGKEDISEPLEIGGFLELDIMQYIDTDNYKKQ